MAWLAALGAFASGCERPPPSSASPPVAPLAPPAPPQRRTIFRDPSDGLCTMVPPFECPAGAKCENGELWTIDCPPDLRGDGPVLRPERPIGKSDWIRVKGFTFVDEHSCWYRPEYFCAPPGQPWACTEPTRVTLSCTALDGDARGAGATRWRIGRFTYKDGLGACRVVPERDCAWGCPEILGDVVPCG